MRREMMNDPRSIHARYYTAVGIEDKDSSARRNAKLLLILKARLLELFGRILHSVLFLGKLSTSRSGAVDALVLLSWLLGRVH